MMTHLSSCSAPESIKAFLPAENHTHTTHTPHTPHRYPIFILQTLNHSNTNNPPLTPSSNVSAFRNSGRLSMLFNLLPSIQSHFFYHQTSVNIALRASFFASAGHGSSTRCRKKKTDCRKVIGFW